MDKRIQRILAEILRRKGVDVLEEPARFLAMLSDLMPGEARVHGLIDATFKLAIPSKINADMAAGCHADVIVCKYTDSFTRDTFFTRDVARQTVRMWYEVLSGKSLPELPAAAEALKQAHPFQSAGLLDAEEQYNLGLMCYKGDATPQDYEKALKSFMLAADQGHAKAQYALGLMYKNGDGAESDTFMASMWFQLSADQGYASAQYNLGVAMLDSSDYEKRLEGISWCYKAAIQGHAPAEYVLGEVFAGNGCSCKNNEASLRWTHRSAAQGYSPAQFRLGTIYHYGGMREVNKDCLEAVKWYLMAANQGSEQAMWALCRIYETGGDGLQKNFVEAESWKAKAIALNSGD